MAKRFTHGKGKAGSPGKPGREDRDREIEMDDWAVVTHAANREEADFYRRLIGEHDIEVLFSDDIDGYEAEEGEEGIAILVPEEEVDTAYHLIKDHEEYVAAGGLMSTDDQEEEEEDDADAEGVPAGHGDYGDYEPAEPDDEEDEDGQEEDAEGHGLGFGDEDEEGPLYYDDEH
jgi:hypothetical protein